MIHRLILITLFFFFGCASSSPLVGYKGGINISAENVLLNSKNTFFGDSTIEMIYDQNLIEERGDYYLNAILDSYWNQVIGIEPTESKSTGMFFDIKHVTVKKGGTINFVDPGPIYKMIMEVDVYKDGIFLFEDKYKAKVNMAEIINPDKVFNWLSTSAKENPENQIATFTIGLRKLYKNMLFKHLGISLIL